jgi:RHS repeat-associated protein
MKALNLIIGGMLLLGGASALRALPADLAPPGGVFGDCDRDGTLIVTDDLREADFGGGLRLPVRWVYRSGDQSVSPYGWNGMSLTVLESKAVKQTASLYVVTLLCGKQLYFSKQSPPPTPVPVEGGSSTGYLNGRERKRMACARWGVGMLLGTGAVLPPPNFGGGGGTWVSNDGQWVGVEGANNSFTIRRWDGWELVYQNGRISRMTTDTGRVLGWDYDGNNPGVANRVYEVATGNTVISVGVSDKVEDMMGAGVGRGAHTVTVNGDTYSFKYENGTLSEVDFPDGRTKQWSFADLGDGTSRLTLTQESGWWKSWVYDNTSRKLKSDDIWSYVVTGGEAGTDGVIYNRPTMQRTRLWDGEVEKVEYQANNSVEIRTDVHGNVTTTSSYQSVGNLYGKTYKIELKRSGESESTVVWRGAYDTGSGDLITSYDSENNETSYAYERFEGASQYQPPKKVTTTDPLGRVNVVERDLQGNVVKMTSPAGIVRVLEWDARHRLVGIKNSSGGVLGAFTYGEADQLLSRTDALGNTTTYEYALHLGVPKLTKVTTPEGRVTQLGRDEMGRITTQTGPTGATWSASYVDDWDVPASLTDPLSAVTHYTYDNRLNTIGVRDPLQNETHAYYDDLNLPAQVTDALGHLVAYQNDADGNLTKLTDARGKIYNLLWQDGVNRKQFKWPDTTSENSSYDINGRLTNWSARGGGAVASFTRNEVGELTQREWSYNGQSGTNSYSRNAGGQLSSANASEGGFTIAQSYGYDASGRLNNLTQTVGGVSRSIGFGYDAAGGLTNLSYPSGMTVGYQYNGDGQVTAIKSGGTTLASYSYDTGGRLVSRTLGNGVTTSYAYDGASQVTNITVSKAGESLWAESYAYNDAGERVSTTRSNSSASYQYDGTYQLIRAISGSNSASWSYDAAGNRTSAQSTNGTNTLSVSYSVNDINQYTSVGGAFPSYNSRGDLSGINGWSFTYDAFGNLSAAQYGTNAAYHYARDPLGRRAIRQSGSNTILLLNAGDTMLEAYNATSNSVTSYIYEPGVDRPLAQVLSNGSIRYVHQDVLGSVVMLTDSNGAAYQSYSYDAWGKVTARDASGSVIPSSAISAPWLFTGRRFDKESGLYHYRARTYSAELGRFLQMDPIKFDAGDPNIYRYVGNDPLNWRDPMGLCLPVIIPLVITAEELLDAAITAAIIDIVSETKAWHNDSPNPDKTGKRDPRKNRSDGKRDIPPKDKPPAPAATPRPYNPTGQNTPYPGPPKDGAPARP